MEKRCIPTGVLTNDWLFFFPHRECRNKFFKNVDFSCTRLESLIWVGQEEDIILERISKNILDSTSNTFSPYQRLMLCEDNDF